MRLRIVDMSNVDVALFEFDFDLTFSVFVLNHEKNIYLRYGGRDDRSPDSYLSENSLAHALESGLKVHDDWKQGKLKLAPPPKPVPATSYPRLKKIVEQGNCIHCHQVADVKSRAMVALPTFNKTTDSFIYPDPGNLGLEIDPDFGNKLKAASGAAKAAGLKAGDTVSAVGGHRVHTFGDLQYALHKLDTDAESVTIATAARPNEAITMQLPEHWRVTDLNRRNIGHRLTPFPGFWSKTLSAEQKQELGLRPDGFASQVTKFWVNTNGKKAGMREGDIVYAVGGVETSPIARNAMIYIRMHHKSGDEVQVQYRREGKDFTAKFKLKEKPW